MHVFCTTFLQLGNFKKKHSAWPRPHPDVPSGAYAVGGPLHPESAAARWVERRCWFEILFEIGLHVPEWSRMAWREPVQTLAVTEFACCMLHDILLPMIFFGWPTNKLYYCFRWGRCATKTMAKLECPASASRQAATLATRPSLFFSRHEMRSACFNDFFPDKQAERASRRL